MSGLFREGDSGKTKEPFRPTKFPILYLDQNWQTVNQDQIAQAYNTTFGLEEINRFLPHDVLAAAGETNASIKKNPVQITPEDFVHQMRVLGEQFVHPNVPTYFGKGTQLCMNLTALMTNYLAEAYGFPVVGLYNSADEVHESYIRPISAIFDRIPQYEQFAYPHRYSLEDMIEVKLGGRIFAVDFNFWYGDERKNGMLIQEVTTRDQRVKLGQDYGLWATEFAGLNNADPLAVASYIKPMDGDSGAAEYYLRKDLPLVFLMNVADEELLAAYNHDVEPYRGTRYEFGERWQSFLYSHEPSGVTVRDYIQRLSIGSLVTQGHTPDEFSGFGRIYLIPLSLEQRRLLAHLPNPEEAVEILSK